jgi:hypothetical protein
MGGLGPISDNKGTSCFKYFCDEIGPNIIVSNCDTRYMMIYFYVINTDNDNFLSINDTFDMSWI